MKLTVYGTGYVGLVTGVCFAELGNEVFCADIDEEKIRQLQSGHVPFYEPKLAELMVKNHTQGRLHFSSDLQMAVAFADVQFICVGTPPQQDGSANLDSVWSIAELIGQQIERSVVVVNKSTVPVGTGLRVRDKIIEGCQARGVDLKCVVASNPEFLREGRAVDDFLHPERVVIGNTQTEVIELFEQLYAPLYDAQRPLLIMDVASAELTKYAANAFLASKISLINEIANIADYVGADIREVAKGVGYDSRIGHAFLTAGCGYGGSCLPKDVKALHETAADAGYETALLQAIDAHNQKQKLMLFKKLEQYFKGNLANKTFAVWGLAFKPGTDDIREATSLDILEKLWSVGAKVRAYDPIASNNIQQYFGMRDDLVLCEQATDCLVDAEALLLLTEWPEFSTPDFQKISEQLKSKVIFDGRNIYDGASARAHGVTVIGIGCNAPGVAR